MTKERGYISISGAMLALTMAAALSASNRPPVEIEPGRRRFMDLDDPAIDLDDGIRRRPRDQIQTSNAHPAQPDAPKSRQVRRAEARAARKAQRRHDHAKS